MTCPAHPQWPDEPDDCPFCANVDVDLLRAKVHATIDRLADTEPHILPLFGAVMDYIHLSQELTRRVEVLEHELRLHDIEVPDDD